MKELGRGTAYNTHNIASLIRSPQVCIRHLADGRLLHGGRVYTHTHTHTQTHTHTRSYQERRNLLIILGERLKLIEILARILLCRNKATL